MSSRMARAIITSVIIFTAAPCAQAQVRFGVQAGLTSAHFVAEENTVPTVDSRIGVCAGAFAGCELGPVVSLQLEMLYTEKGSEAAGIHNMADGPSGQVLKHEDRSVTRLSYLEMPLLLNLAISTPTRQVFKFYLGPYYSIRLAAEQSIRNKSMGTGISVDSTYYTAAAQFRGYDAGLMVGGTIPLGKFEIGGRYSMGLPEVIVPVRTDFNTTVNQKNRVIAVLLGYTF